MSQQSLDPAAELSAAVSTYTDTNDYGALLERLLAIAEVTEPDALAAAAEPYLGIPEVAGPLYERIVAATPKRCARDCHPRELLLAHGTRGRGDRHARRARTIGRSGQPRRLASLGDHRRRTARADDALEAGGGALSGG